MAIPTWATAADLEAAMGEDAFREIYDQDLDGVADADKVAMDLRRAHAQVAARVRQPHNGSLPDGDHDGFYQLATLEFAQAYACERHPEYRKVKGEFMKRGEVLCTDLRAGRALPAPATTEPVPSMGGGGAVAADSALPIFARDSRRDPRCCR